MMPEKSSMQEHVVLKVVSRFLIPFILLYALYVQFHGDYSPGGGFQAGVIGAAAFILYALVFGLDMLLKIFPFSMIRILACLGPLLYAGVGLLTHIMGGEFLNYSMLSGDSVDGQHYGIFLVELGVGVTVFSVMLMIYILFAQRGMHKPTKKER
jgi:multicomponent Na+:H+ antiporter subunit B